ncbi:MAG: DNA replication/repair protein RecF [Clostridiales bacterium]|nr:DNA replication/repair protein RecF [Clostridiales bacterium]
MHIREVEIVNFRNYKEEKIKFHEKLNVFTGGNAQGKTNILESIYISSMGRSFRSGKDSEMIKIGESFCKSKVVALRGGEEITVEIAITSKEKGVKINNAKIKKSSELAENVLIVVFSPEDLRIVQGDPERRRRFMDRELSQIKPSYYSDLSSYKRVLTQRNALLKDRNANKVDFEVWDEKMVDHGSRIIKKREIFVDKINTISGKIHSEITNGKESLKVLYDCSVSPDSFLDALKDNFKKDILRGNTETGPHRDDLEIRANGMDIRRFGSQGQQRTAALSLKLAEINIIKEETGESPVLLLDDVLSELDGERQNFLIKSLKNVQIFLTAAEISNRVFEKLPDGYTFYVDSGSVKKEVVKWQKF